MTELETKKPDTKPDAKPDAAGGLLPGMAVIALWMLAQCGIGLIGVILHRLPVGAMVMCLMFALAANGLLKLKRWGWALTLGAAFLSMCYAAFVLFRFHQLPMIVMLTVNLIFFLYLIRPEVLERVK